MKNSAHIVTGATGGIGQAIVEHLVKEKAGTIILACRNAAKAQVLIDRFSGCGSEIIHYPLNLMSFASIRQMANQVKETGLIVMTLYNNAGTMPGDVIISEDGYEAATQTNFLGPALLTRLLLDCMSNGSHIVLTTSVTRHIARIRSDWNTLSIDHHSRFVTYGRSKLMLAHWGKQLSEELKPRGISVNLSNPGVVSTGIITLGHKWIDCLADHLVRPVISTPQQGAMPALLAAESPLTGHIFSRRLFHTSVAPAPDDYMQPVPCLPKEITALSDHNLQ